MSDYDDFIALVDRIKATISRAGAARRLPADRTREVEYIRIVPHSDAQKIIADRMREQAVAEERRQGEIARDRELKRLAMELDALRQRLPEAAQKARFDLLDQVREMRA